MYRFYKLGISKEDVRRQYQKTIKESTYIMHALGGVDGFAYTNSLEALERNYEMGHRLFEVDVCFTSDDILVCGHGWKKKDFIEKMGVDYTRYNKMPDFNTFACLRFHGIYHPLSFLDIIQFIDIHRDTFFMIDSRKIDYDETKRVFQAIVSDAGNRDDLLRHLIVSGYTIEMIRAIRDVYDFPFVNMYLARESEREPQIKEIDDFFRYCCNNRIFSFSTDKSRYEENVCNCARENKMISYVFGINQEDEITSFMREDNIVIGTDFLGTERDTKR